MSFQLSGVVPWGRSYDEYVDMFDLTQTDLNRRILGCGDGPASFNSVLTDRGGRIVSCDPLYRFSSAEIRFRIDETASVIGAQLRENSSDFVWSRFDSVEALVESRLAAMDRFLQDLPAGSIGGRYIDASLPELPFRDREFDVALCSHFLFLYSEQHDLGFHVRSMLELCRVAAEVRVFPLLELGTVVSRHLESLLEALDGHGLKSAIVDVPYEFQRGGDQMLVVEHPHRTIDSRSSLRIRS